MRRDIGLVSTAEELRREFDASFAAEPARIEAQLDVLAIRAGRPCAVRLRAIDSLLLVPRITPAPSRATELLGLVSMRGAVIPVYDLRALLGLAAAEVARWMVVAGSPALGLAFEMHDGCVRVAASAVSTDAGNADEVVRGAVTIDGTPRALLDVEAIHRVLMRRARTGEGR